VPVCHPQPSRAYPERWYVARALGEETAISASPRLNRRGGSLAAALAAFVVLSVGIAACGSGPRQDADEPIGNFPVAVDTAKFPTEQRLAETSNLELDIENTGSDQVPNLAVTIYTGDTKGGESFSVRSDQPGLADPNRPVWVLEFGFPKVLDTGQDESDLADAPTAGAEVAQTDTFAFGPLAAGDTKRIFWQVTPVQAGTYTIHYELAAGLNGNAKAVTDDGSPVKGEFVVTVTDKPPQARVNDSGQVEIN
jgi:hypothetical protein